MGKCSAVYIFTYLEQSGQRSPTYAVWTNYQGGGLSPSLNLAEKWETQYGALSEAKQYHDGTTVKQKCQVFNSFHNQDNM